MVLLPGALMTPQHMVDAGMFEAVRERALDLDLLAVNLHALGDSNRRSLACSGRRNRGAGQGPLRTRLAGRHFARRPA